jgi:hypothetical protein
MTIKREPDELPGGVIVNVVNGVGVTVDADHEEFEDMVADKDVTYPTAHTANSMALQTCIRGTFHE